MGSQSLPAVSDLSGVFALLALAAAIYFFAGLRRPLALSGDVFESVRWGKLFVGLVYACVAVVFFCMAFIRR
jgi:hypothetical protein